jgi:Chaperone for protein-folding within the ER, fungal
MQWQHGTYSLPGNGSIVLEPFGVDGRQLVSNPCSYDQSIYTRYNQPELILSYQVLTDPYHNVPRLNLAKFDGSPMNPMFLVYSPPQMLPTKTLNPTSGTPAATAKSRVKRGLEERDKETQQDMTGRNVKNVIQAPSDLFNADKWWWVGVGLTALGTVMYMMPAST